MEPSEPRASNVSTCGAPMIGLTVATARMPSPGADYSAASGAKRSLATKSSTVRRAAICRRPLSVIM